MLEAKELIANLGSMRELKCHPGRLISIYYVILKDGAKG